MGAWVLDVKSLDDGQLWSITGSPQTLYLVSVLFCNHPLGRKQSLLLNGLRCSAIQIQLACFVHYTLPIISIKLRERLRKGFGKSDHKDLDQTLGLPWCLNCNDILNCPTLTGASPVPVRPKCSSGQGCWVGLVNLCVCYIWDLLEYQQVFAVQLPIARYVSFSLHLRSCLCPDSDYASGGFQHVVSLAPGDRFLLAVSGKQMTSTVGGNQQSTFLNAPVRSQSDLICPEIALCEYTGH